MLQPYGSRQAVRQLLLWEDEDPDFLNTATLSIMTIENRMLFGSSHFR
jgi:hypothetical protein